MSLTRGLLSKIVPACALIIGLAAPAMAQSSPKTEVSVGYNFLHLPDENIPGGWYADVAGNVTPMFGIVGQVTGNYKTIDEGGTSIDAKLHTFMAGVRVNGRLAGGVVPFVQVLGGAARTSGSTDVVGVTVSDSTTDGALQLGGGVKFAPGGRIGLQVGADYLRIFTEGSGTNAYRVAAGVTFGF